MILRTALLFFIARTVALPAFVLHDAPALPCFWQVLDRVVPEEHPIIVHFALKQRNLDVLRSIATSVSDPQSSTYGQYLSRDDGHMLTAPESSHIEAVEAWLTDAGVPFKRLGGKTIVASFSVASATKLLRTKFHHATNLKTQQVVVRAGEYWMPSKVHDAVAAVYGLHGLPPPPRESLRSVTGTADITPAVIQTTYQVSGVKVSSLEKNRQAVASFQGQTTNATDLKEFFKKFDPAAPASDAKVYRFVGNNASGSEGDEAGLDIEYIMGVAPGILTEFWYWGSADFCADLKNWTDTILADADAPLVHSVSYGYQGALTELGCQEPNVLDIDANFMKLAASGITIIFASGDDGSGMVDTCGSDAAHALNTTVKGTGAKNSSVMTALKCCEAAAHSPNTAAWTFTPPTPKLKGPKCSPQSGVAFDGVEAVTALVNVEFDCCYIATSGNVPDIKGYTYIPNSDNVTGSCILYKNISGKKEMKSASSSTLTLTPGTCTLFSGFTSKEPAPGSISGGDLVKPVPPKFYPAWPASSPWVTSVGATRFIGQKVGEREMASDSFGSGGGFSTMFSAFKDQAEAVNHYLEVASGLPPKGSFPPGGRATPDVSALGEGFQVLVNGVLTPTDGTSASTPTFAAMVSLLNEARLQDGKPPMGYLNPFLYQNANAFTDVDVGTNSIFQRFGFKCAKGWDPATGLGTPIFTKLLRAAMAAETNTIVV